MKEALLTHEEIQFLVDWFVVSKNLIHIKENVNYSYQKTLEGLLEKIGDGKKEFNG